MPEKYFLEFVSGQTEAGVLRSLSLSSAQIGEDKKGGFYPGIKTDVTDLDSEHGPALAKSQDISWPTVVPSE